MLRTLFAVVLGMLAALAAMFLLEALGMLVFPPPPGFQLTDEADLARLVAAASPAHLAWVVGGWALASVVGGWVAARIGRAHPRGAAVAVAGLIVIGTLMNALVIPHPLWMNLLGVALPVPLALLGARLARGRPTPAT